MHRNPITLLYSCILSFPLYTQAQYQFDDVTWQPDEREQSVQIRYWENGKVRLKNAYEGLQKYRYQYDQTGTLRLKAPIRWLEGCDTVVTFDPDTFLETYQFYCWAHDSPYGVLRTYYASGALRTRALSYTGKWHWYRLVIAYAKSGTLQSVSHFNKWGDLHGVYHAYYPSGQLQQYGTWEQATHYCDRKVCWDPETFEPDSCDQTRPVIVRGADWRYFSPQGNPYTPQSNQQGDDIR